MKKKIQVVVLIISLLCTSTTIARADSPLTSTEFYTAYTLPKFNTNEDFFKYLADETKPIDYRVAAINRAGWENLKKGRCKEFQAFLAKKYDLKSDDIKTLTKALSGKILICLAYVKAMDNYFNVDIAMEIASTAIKKEPKSYTVNIIAGLINAQDAVEIDDDRVYESTDVVRKNKSLIKDMKQAAIDIIFEYQDLYK